MVNLDDSADHDGPASEDMPSSSSNPACDTVRAPVYSDSIFGPTQAPNPVSPYFSPFCQHRVDPVLDSHRHKGKNTHELIVLPAIRQVLRADPAMWHWPLVRRHALACRQRSSLLSAHGQSRFPRQQDLSWRGGYPSEPWPRDLEPRSTPTKIFTADRTLNVCQKT